MAYSKLSFLFSATLAFTIAGCGSDDSDNSGDGDETSEDGAGGSTDGSGGTSSDTGGTSSDTGGTTGSPDSSTDAGGTASDSGGTSGTPTSSTTTGASGCNPVDMGSGGNGGSDECTAYSECVQRECDDEYTECWGPDYASGDLSGGSCSPVFECAEDCESGDTCDFNCLINCFGSASDSCTTCLETAEECGAEACPDEYEQCNGSQTTSTTGDDTSTTGGFEGTCEDLEACCDSLEGQDQQDCLDSLESLQGSGDNADQYCSIVLFGYQAGGQCEAAP